MPKEKQDIFTLIGGKVKLHRSNYNPTSDAVWLAAMPTGNPKTILDVGIGTGGVALCLQHHFPNARITGLDIAPEMLDTCAKNAELNGFEFELLNQDILKWSTPRTFDLVVSNPPYFQGTPTRANPAAHHNANLDTWIRRCVARVKPRGYFCTIVDAGCVANVITVMAKTMGDITVIPLFGAKKIAERVLIRGRVGTRGPSTLHFGLPMNYEPVLRNGLTLGKILGTM